MKYCALFLFNCIQFFCVAQKATNSTSTAISSSSVTSTIINLNPITGNKFFTIDTKNTSYVYLLSYEDFKKQFQDLSAKGDEKYIQEFIFKNLEDNFSKKDTIKTSSLKELNTYDRFKEMFDKFQEESFKKNNYLVVEKKTGKKETILIHKEGDVTMIVKNEKRDGWQDEYFLPDEKTSIHGDTHGVWKIKVKKED